MPVELSSLQTGAAAGAGKAHRHARSAPSGTDAGGLGFLGALTDASDAQEAGGSAQAPGISVRKSARATPDTDGAPADSNGMAPAMPVRLPPTEAAVAPAAAAFGAFNTSGSQPAASATAVVALAPGSSPVPMSAAVAETSAAGVEAQAAPETLGDRPSRDHGAASAPDAASPSLFAQMQAVLHHAPGGRVAPAHSGMAAPANGAGAGAGTGSAPGSATAASQAASSREPTAALHALQSAFASAEGALPVALPALTGTGPRREESGRGTSATAASTDGPGVPTATGSDFAETGVAATAELPPAFAMPDEETTRYWGSPALQNAELTVQADGADVAVRVSLAGQEAQVAFRSDHAAARELLASGVGELQTMLAAEGVLLSGVSVGTSQSGRQGEGAPSRQARRNDGLRPPEAGGAAIDGAAMRPARPTALGALDLYV